MNAGSAPYSAGRSLYGGLSDTSRRGNIPEEVLRNIDRMQREKTYFSNQHLAIAAYLSQFKKSPFFRDLLMLVETKIIPHKSVRAANFTDSCVCRSARCICPSHAGELSIEDLCNQNGSSAPALRGHHFSSAPFNGYVPPRDEHDFKADRG